MQINNLFSFPSPSHGCHVMKLNTAFPNVVFDCECENFDGSGVIKFQLHFKGVCRFEYRSTRCVEWVKPNVPLESVCEIADSEWNLNSKLAISTHYPAKRHFSVSFCDFDRFDLQADEFSYQLL